MTVKFGKEYLSELYYNGRSSDKRHRFRPDIVERYKRRIDTLWSATCIEALYRIHSLRYEVLRGDKAGISSIRVNDQYRIEFIVEKQENDSSSDEQITICNIVELSKHYQ